MSVLIKGMEMPKEDELLCIRIYPSGKVIIDLDLQCKQVAEAVELPDHGDLIDRDRLMKGLREYACKPCKEYGADKNGDRCEWCSFDDAFARIEKAKTVIPAERNEE